VTPRLADTHVLVADDQSDVARTLCRPLERPAHVYISSTVGPLR
jgi:hypothetical protein